MPALSFKLKMLLAMMGVVAGVTGATLYTTQAGFQEYIQILYGHLFEAQTGAFFDKQNLLLDNIKKGVKPLVGSVRLQLALLEANEAETNELALRANDLYVRAKTELDTRGIDRGFYLFLIIF